ncbi:nectin-4 isoform X2 [Siphateles boraxobius]|uniref:nectin-4 isoform X2 n=1 Tax=Siphateles boraxobius TaxID=180520 RepID=UPI004063C1A2
MKTVSYILAAMIFWNSACVSGEQERFLEPSKNPWVLQSLGEEETRLPCRFNVSDSETRVVQVTWIRLNSNGAEEQIITVHFSEGQTENPAYTGRVRFETNNPIADSALIIMRTSSADEGKYTCKVATFPSGNFETAISLTVWTKPITSLEDYVLVEGQTFRPAATCRSMAKPIAGLSWDTDLSGQSQNLSLDVMVSSIQFSLHPLRNMNGRKLDCLVWHPSQSGPTRISNKLTVHYPPNALISGYEDSWHVEMQGATLQCNGEGNPKPHRFNWTRKGEALPEGVTVDGGTLSFSRPLLLTDQGDYICTTTNLVGSGKAEISISISESLQKQTSVNYMLMIMIAGIAGAVVVTLIVIIISVNRHYKRRNQQLAIELNEKKEEISTLSRQASFRRVNSSSTDNRYSEENHPLRVEGTIRTSLSSLDRPRSRDSRSTLGAVDSLGRPAIYNSSRRGRDKLIERSDRESTRMMMMESYEEDSNMSQETQLLPPLHPSSYSMDQAIEMVQSRNGSAILPAEGRPRSGGSSRGHHSPIVSTYPNLTDEEEEDSVSPADSGVHRGLMELDAFENGGSETASSQISEALSNHFERTNGTLRPKSKPNNILLPANTKLFLSPHSPNIHKAQIV